jgi:hypothetical protein
MDIRIEKYYQMKIPVDMANMVHKLLKSIPQEHLIGLSAIILTDQLSQNKHAEGLYWPKKEREPAKIGMALGMIYKGVPNFVFYLPFITKFMLASVLYHEIGHHYQRHVHGVKKKEQESFAEQYKKQMIKQTFSYLRPFLLPISPLVSLFVRFVKNKR